MTWHNTGADPAPKCFGEHRLPIEIDQISAVKVLLSGQKRTNVDIRRYLFTTFKVNTWKEARTHTHTHSCHFKALKVFNIEGSPLTWRSCCSPPRVKHRFIKEGRCYLLSILLGTSSFCSKTNLEYMWLFEFFYGALVHQGVNSTCKPSGGYFGRRARCSGLKKVWHILGKQIYYHGRTCVNAWYPLDTTTEQVVQPWPCWKVRQCFGFGLEPRPNRGI